MSRLFRTLAINAKANVSSDTFLRWTIGLTVGAWVVAVGAMLSGVASPMLGMTLLSMIATGLAFVVLLASQNSAEPNVTSRHAELRPEPAPGTCASARGRGTKSASGCPIQSACASLSAVLAPCASTRFRSRSCPRTCSRCPTSAPGTHDPIEARRVDGSFAWADGRPRVCDLCGWLDRTGNGVWSALVCVHRDRARIHWVPERCSAAPCGVGP